MSPPDRLVQESSDPKQLLLVDDDPLNLLLTATALRERGFLVTEVYGGEPALELLAGWVPDMVLLDALMPGMDGFTTCQRLRKTPGLERLPVLMLTGLDDDASIKRAYDCGATDFFVKSNRWSLLEMRLHHMLRASRMLTELERSKGKLARAQDIARMGSFEWHRDSGDLVLSPECLRVFGLGPNETRSWRQLVRMVARDRRSSLIARLRDGLQFATPLTADVALQLQDGRLRTVRVEAEPLLNKQDSLSGYSGIVQDVTERRVAEDKIRHLANFDTLTGLPNRRNLIWRAERAVEQAVRMEHQVGLMLIDLDRFKEINDTLGHGAGDQALIEVARRLRSCVRHSDDVVETSAESLGSRTHRQLEAVGRLGGDEFVALLPEVGSEQDVERVAQRVLDVMREPIVIEGKDYFITASVGVSLFPRDGATVAEVLGSADAAMYNAKDAGRNAYSVYRPQLSGEGRKRLELQSALHKAIDRGEMVLHYQPKIDLHTGRMAGVEALMRWQRGGVLVPPNDFIPLAEESGLIVPMSEWLINEAARQGGAWERVGFHPTIAVNLPSRFFERTDLVALIQGAAARHGATRCGIELEITESSLMKQLKNSPTLHRLSEAGIEIAIDDFGTGYSSLAYLTALPLSELKIDRSFIGDLGTTPQSSAVVTAIIALATALGFRVVAEGVEDLSQMKELYRLGCHLMQGYLFSRPLPADELYQWHQQVLLPGKAAWAGQVGSPGVAALPSPLAVG